METSNSNIDVHFSSATNEWATPQEFYNKLDGYFHFTLDPCCTKETAKCSRYYTIKEDGLKQDWGKEVCFVNPPYGREIGKWVKKSYEASLKGATVVMLIPSRTDTAWWHDYVTKGSVGFIRGRIKFIQEGREGVCAPFPSCLVLFAFGFENKWDGSYDLAQFVGEYNKKRLTSGKKSVN